MLYTCDDHRRGIGIGCERLGGSAWPAEMFLSCDAPNSGMFEVRSGNHFEVLICDFSAKVFHLCKGHSRWPYRETTPDEIRMMWLLESADQISHQLEHSSGVGAMTTQL